MKRSFLPTIVLALILSVINVNAQETEQKDQLSLTEGTIENQFEYVYQKSNSFEEYKVVKKGWLILLKKNILDSVGKIEQNLASITQTSQNQQSEIDKLKGDLSTVNSQLTEVTAEKDSMSLFGVQLGKGAYRGIMWGIIALLAAILAVFIYKFRNANVVTAESKKALNDLENEYEDYRRKALEREQKARRMLQDEINKQKLAKAK